MTRPILKLKTPRRRLDKKRNGLYAQEATLVRLFGTEAVKRLQAAQKSLDEAMSGESSGAPGPAKARRSHGNGHAYDAPRSTPGQEASIENQPSLERPRY